MKCVTPQIIPLDVSPNSVFTLVQSLLMNTNPRLPVLVFVARVAVFIRGEGPALDEIAVDLVHRQHLPLLPPQTRVRAKRREGRHQVAEE